MHLGVRQAGSEGVDDQLICISPNLRVDSSTPYGVWLRGEVGVSCRIRCALSRTIRVYGYHASSQ